jgi:quinolinate synthase
MTEKYLNMGTDELRRRIKTAKSEAGPHLTILGHYYQKDEVIEFADFQGDSLGLCQQAVRQKDVKYIVFCGVHFMAESADILSTDEQIVQLPDMAAGCPLADFANIDMVEAVWSQLEKRIGTKDIIPITYINSDAGLKAFCGRHGGSVCTSSNADAILRWALNKGRRVFFFPDQHLGRNTANKIGIPRDQILLWTLGKEISDQSLERSKIILWDGYCHVHHFFSTDHVAQVREDYPDVKIIVHPECNEDVVKASDENGSTSKIVNYINDAESGSVIAIGTEFNLVHRLAHQRSDITVIPLAKSICHTMNKISLSNLCYTLDNIGKHNVVKVKDDIKKDAIVALNQMLSL